MPEIIRVRFAPSPTGYLHVGGARTAIFNWLYARKHKGKFLLRIEDTDTARSGEEMTEAIYDGLRWLGLEWDEEPVRQSSRFEIYRSHAEGLVAQGKAFKCFCSPESLQAAREQAVKEKRTFRYDRHCLQLSPEERQANETAGTPYVIRLKVEPGQTRFTDRVYGEIKVDHRQLDDFIIIRSDGIPTYHLAVVVDDHEMKISHVIRGEDHVSNTAKHILLYQAFDWQAPEFAHLPLILGPDHQRLSKRHGATAVSEYKKAGFLPDAMFNFLTLLGWSSGDDRELFSREQLIAEFSLEGVMRKSAVFDEKKLEWMNGQYILNLGDDEFLALMQPYLSEFQEQAQNQQLIKRIAALMKPRTRRLADLPDQIRYFFEDPVNYDEQAVKKHWKTGTADKLLRVKQRLSGLKEFTLGSIEQAMRGLSEEMELSAGKVIHPTRIALTGIAATPGMFEVIELLGKETVIRRLDNAITYLEKEETTKAEFTG